MTQQSALFTLKSAGITAIHRSKFNWHSIGNRKTVEVFRQKVYIETSIISYLTAGLSNDLRVAANQNVTIEWWDTRRSDFEPFVSELVIAEARLGDSKLAQKRMDVISVLPILDVTEKVRELAKKLVSEGPFYSRYS